MKTDGQPRGGFIANYPELLLPLAILPHPRTSACDSCSLKYFLATLPPSQCRGNLRGGGKWGGPCVNFQAEVDSSGETAKLCGWLCILVLSVCSYCLKMLLWGGGNDVAQVGASNGLNCGAGFTPVQRGCRQTHPLWEDARCSETRKPLMFLLVCEHLHS